MKKQAGFAQDLVSETIRRRRIVVRSTGDSELSAGFAHIWLFVAVVVAVVGFVGWRVLGTIDGATTSSQQFDGSACPSQPMMISPADVSLVTSVLYPGQTRGGDYKAHGGLYFGNSQDNKATVKAPMDAKLTIGSRYIEQGEVQILLEFSNTCGVMYRFDHLLTLTDKFQKAVDASLPAPKLDDSRTSDFKPAVNVTKGEIIATAVGFAKTGYTGLDFGIYDMRKQNGVTKANNDLASHGVCWLHDWLPADDSAKLLALPGGDQDNGKNSDYCK